MIFYALPIVFLLHCLEEWKFGFPEWAVRHFGPITTHKFYLLSHIPLMAIVLAVSLATVRFPEMFVLRFYWLIILTVIVTNGIFHVVSTLLFNEYSPGLITSMIFTFPYAWVCYLSSMPELAQSRPIGAIAAGSIVSLLIVYSLTWRKVI